MGFAFRKPALRLMLSPQILTCVKSSKTTFFYFEVEDEEMKLMKEMPYELLKDNEKKQLGKNEEAKMTIYNALPRKEFGHSSKNHVRKFLRAQPLKWRAKVTAIEEAKDLATLPLDELIGNIKVYEMVLDNDGVGSKTTKEKFKSLALKAKVTREKTSDDSDSQGGSDEDIDEEEEAEAFNLLARNFRRGNSFKDKGGESSKKKGACYNCGIKGHFASECRKPKENKAFMGGAWSDSEDGDEHQNDATCLMAIESQEVVSKPSSYNIDLNIIDLQKENEELLNKINDLEIEVKKLANDKEVVEPCKTCDVLTKEVNSLKCNVSRLQDEALNFSKFKESSIALDDMLSRRQGNANNRSRKEVSATRVLELLHLDLREPSLIQSYGGNFYTLIIVDDHSNYTWVMFVESKSTSGRGGKWELLDVGVVGLDEDDEFYSQTSKAYIVLNKETIRIEESLNATFNESFPEPKSSPSVEDNRINEPIAQVLNVSLLLQVNVSDEGYPKSLKEARGHPIEQVIGELNERTLRSKTKQA
ncbi:retrotransposon protein [Tanacetum coccineum]|uniref:Retrotransposon protein n=1 Tax=Tanacetum coccineum TaxID=301880 RepID=A0ABQ5G041_9ASTR